MRTCEKHIQQIANTPDDEINKAITAHVYAGHEPADPLKFTESRDLCFVFEKPLVQSHGLHWTFYVNYLSMLEDFTEIEDRWNIICASPKLRARAFVLTMGLIQYKP